MRHLALARLDDPGRPLLSHDAPAAARPAAVAAAAAESAASSAAAAVLRACGELDPRDDGGQAVSWMDTDGDHATYKAVFAYG